MQVFARMGGVICVVDCNNFFVSCQRVLDPSLEGVACVVLSNNDGVVIARSAEAKSLGIKMAQPFFQVRALCRREGVKVFSADFRLYRQLSGEVMAVVSKFAPSMEVYSIDEAFLDWRGVAKRYDLVEHAAALRMAVRERVGIPVSVGIAPTKVLAKIANHAAKDKTTTGVFCVDETNREQLLSELPIDEVWGIGRQSASKLSPRGIRTGLALAEAPDARIKPLLGIMGQRVKLELNGMRCFPIETQAQAAQSIQVTRSFSNAITSQDDLAEAVATFAQQAGKRLRQQGEVAKGIGVYIRNSRHDEREPFFSASQNVIFESATDDTAVLIKGALNGLSEIYKDGVDYKKAGVTLLEIAPKTLQSGELFEENADHRHDSLMRAFDELAQKYEGQGKNVLFWGAEGISHKWAAQRAQLGDEIISTEHLSAQRQSNKDPKLAPKIKFVG